MKKIEDYKNARDLLSLYRNYLFAIREREEYGDMYGDTDHIMKIYEEELKRRKILKDKHNS